MEKCRKESCPEPWVHLVIMTSVWTPSWWIRNPRWPDSWLVSTVRSTSNRSFLRSHPPTHWIGSSMKLPMPKDFPRFVPNWPLVKRDLIRFPWHVLHIQKLLSLSLPHFLPVWFTISIISLLFPPVWFITCNYGWRINFSLISLDSQFIHFFLRFFFVPQTSLFLRQSFPSCPATFSLLSLFFPSFSWFRVQSDSFPIAL